jgi:hypothetical protein
MTATNGAIASDQVTRALLGMAAHSERHKHRVCIREHPSVVRPMSSDTDDGGWEAFKCHTRSALQPARSRL